MKERVASTRVTKSLTWTRVEECEFKFKIFLQYQVLTWYTLLFLFLYIVNRVCSINFNINFFPFFF